MFPLQKGTDSGVKSYIDAPDYFLAFKVAANTSPVLFSITMDNLTLLRSMLPLGPIQKQKRYIVIPSTSLPTLLAFSAHFLRLGTALLLLSARVLILSFSKALAH